MNNNIISIRLFFLCFWVLCFSGLSACGGGSDSSEADPTSASSGKIQQVSLAFTPSHVDLKITSNRADYMLTGGLGSGEVGVTSSNRDVVTIDQGESSLLIVGEGEATVTAVKEGDDTYKKSTAELRVTVSKLEQEAIEFDEEPFLMSIIDDPAQISYSGGSGDGEVTWTVEDSGIATIEDGVISRESIGQTEVTLEISGDDMYKPQKANFRVDVRALPEHIVALIGKEDTQLIVNNGRGSSDLYCTTSFGCSLGEESRCDGTSSLSTESSVGEEVVDSTLSLDSPGCLRMDYRDVPTSSAIAVTPTPTELPDRRGHAVVSIDGKMVMLGGLRYEGPDGDDVYYNDIWTSTDGASWREAASAANFRERKNHEVVKFNDELLLLGGVVMEPNGSTGPIGDGWRSDDGLEWTEIDIRGYPQFPREFDIAAFNGQLWVIGTDWYQATLWSSDNGRDWEQRDVQLPFLQREGYELVAFNQKLWLYGGYVSTGEESYATNDIWSTEDGVDWQLERENADFPPKQRHEVVKYDGQLWLVGGQNDGTLENDIWVSDDGINWRRSQSDTFEFDGYSPSVTVHNDALWIVGGVPTSSVWRYTPEDGWRSISHLSVEWQPYRGMPGLSTW